MIVMQPLERLKELANILHFETCPVIADIENRFSFAINLSKFNPGYIPACTILPGVLCQVAQGDPD